MLRALLVLPLLIALAEAQNPTPIVVPQFADGGGWRSSIGIFNTFGVELARVRVQFRGREGQLVPVPLQQFGVVRSLDLELRTHSSVFLQTTGTSPEVQMGWVEVLQLTASTPVRAYAVFRQTVPGRPDFEAVATGMKPSSSLTFPFDNTEGIVTSFAMVNLGVSDCAVGVSPVQDESGASLISQPKIAGNLAPNGHAAFIATDRIPEIAGRRGYLQFFPLFGCTGGIAVLGLRFNPSGPFTNLSPLIVELF